MTAVTARPVRRRLGNVLLALGLLVGLLSWPTSASALSGELRAATPSALSVLLSQQVVSPGAAEAFLVAPDDAPVSLAGAGAALGALPGEVSLLLTTRGSLVGPVAAEVDRIRNDRTVAHVLGDPAVAAVLEARGLTVNLVEGADPTALAVALADQTFGVAAGTGQRIVATSVSDPVAAGVAAAWGANVGVPVIPVDGSWQAEAFLREVVLVADPAAVGDDAVTAPGNPSARRVWDADRDGLGQALGGLLAAEPKDGDLADRHGTATIFLDADEVDPHPALLAPVASAAYALHGLDATVRFGAPDGSPNSVVLGLAADAPPPPAPLPATGGGLAGAGLLVVSGLAVRRSSRG